MTPEEAKTADVFLNFIASRTKVGRGEFNQKFQIDDDERKKYMSLLIGDKLIENPIYEEKDALGEIVKKTDSSLKITPHGKSFYYFNGGYTKMIENEIKEERSKKRKEIFDIAKDILLILLSCLSLYIGTS